jgi:hypothetical protein
MNFVYVLPGWEGTEGSAHDSRVVVDATTRGFRTPPGKYYLGDVGYSNSSLILTPYQGIRYHPREQAKQNGLQTDNSGFKKARCQWYLIL